MPNIKSAKKRVLVNKRNQEKNKAIKSSVRTQIKKFNKAVSENEISKVEELLPKTFAVIDKSQSKGVLHKNAAARLKAQAASKLSSLKTKKAEPKVETKKVEPKVEQKSEVKVAVAKPATKKVTAKTEAIAKPAKISSPKTAASKAETTEKPAKKVATKSTKTTTKK